MTDDVAPRRNLPPEAEAWGRWMEGQLMAALSGNGSANRAANGVQAAQSGLVQALAAQAEVLRETREELARYQQIAEPSVAPLAPAKPELTTALGTVSVNWDGLLGGEEPEKSFACVLADISHDAGATWNRAGQALSAAGAIVVALPVGKEAWFRLVAMNNAGDFSQPSPVAFIVVEGLTAGSEIADGVIVEKHLAAEAVTANAIAVGALDGQIITGVTLQTNKEPDRGVKISGPTLLAYDAKGNQVASLGGPNGAVLAGGFSTKNGWYRAELVDSGDTSGGRLTFLGSSYNNPIGEVSYNHSTAQLILTSAKFTDSTSTEEPARVDLSFDRRASLSLGYTKSVRQPDGSSVVIEPPMVGVRKDAGPFMTRDGILAVLQPPGTVQTFATFGAAGNGWLECNGQLVSRAAYPGLFKAIGISFGSGDGATTFRIPDYRGRTLVGFDAGSPDFNSIGKTGGHRDIPYHNHYVTPEGAGHAILWGPDGNVHFDVNGQQVYAVGGGATGNGMFTRQNYWNQTGHSGNPASTSNLPPYAVVVHCIKT